MWYTMDVQETIKKLKTNAITGLSEVEANERLEKYGENVLKEKKKENIFIRFLKQFNDFMIIILIVASIISAVMAYLDGSGDYIDSIIIISIVIFNAVMGLIQEEKAEKSLEALRKMAAPIAKVKREGKIKEIEVAKIVPGDIIIIEAGNYVPADCRLIEANDLKIEESSLTGETVPVLKQANNRLMQNTPLADQVNMAFATTIAVNGHGEAIVTQTGMDTTVGKIANMIIEDEAPETPIQKKLSEVGKMLGTGCLIICAIIFVIGIFKKIPIGEMFMTSVGLAVAAIPEGLPAIVTIMLSIGVTKMAKKNSIIRKLPAVETLGSSSVICSDKTGTLTQNKMTVTSIRNALGEANQEDKIKILELGMMCTDTQEQSVNGARTIMGEPTEVAIVNAGVKNNLSKLSLYTNMKRVKDIPFDSTRKMMTTIHRINHGYRIITKGAPDVLLKRCSQYYQNGQNVPIYSKKELIEKQNNDMANSALRVIAVAYKDVEQLPNFIDSKSIENDLIFVGLIGMIDPPREGVKEAVKTCRKAGIKTVMITGDHIQTAKAIAKEILEFTGQEDLHFYDAAAPIISKDSINFNIAFWGNRYEQERPKEENVEEWKEKIKQCKEIDKSYINLPLNKEEYEKFWNELVSAEVVELHQFEKSEIFEGCMPVEVMAKRGMDTLRYGPLKPMGFTDLRTGYRPYAVVQLRQDNEEGTLYNMVGFQTNLKFGEQKRVFSMIPGLENAEFMKYGVMHRNTFINSTKLLDNTYNLKSNNNIFFAGQITGVEGYVESISSGLVAGINAANMILGKSKKQFPKETVIGALAKYISTENEKFQPMNANFGILPELDGEKIRDKKLRYTKLADRALENI